MNTNEHDQVPGDPLDELFSSYSLDDVIVCPACHGPFLIHEGRGGQRDDEDDEVPNHGE